MSSQPTSLEWCYKASIGNSSLNEIEWKQRYVESVILPDADSGRNADATTAFFSANTYGGGCGHNLLDPKDFLSAYAKYVSWYNNMMKTKTTSSATSAIDAKWQTLGRQLQAVYENAVSSGAVVSTGKSGDQKQQQQQKQQRWKQHEYTPSLALLDRAYREWTLFRVETATDDQKLGSCFKELKWNSSSVS